MSRNPNRQLVSAMRNPQELTDRQMQLLAHGIVSGGANGSQPDPNQLGTPQQRQDLRQRVLQIQRQNIINAASDQVRIRREQAVQQRNNQRQVRPQAAVRAGAAPVLVSDRPLDRHALLDAPNTPQMGAEISQRQDQLVRELGDWRRMLRAVEEDGTLQTRLYTIEFTSRYDNYGDGNGVQTE